MRGVDQLTVVVVGVARREPGRMWTEKRSGVASNLEVVDMT